MKRNDDLRKQASELRKLGLSFREIGKQLGVSHERIRQILPPEPPKDQESEDRRLVEQALLLKEENSEITRNELAHILGTSPYKITLAFQRTGTPFPPAHKDLRGHRVPGTPISVVRRLGRACDLGYSPTDLSLVFECECGECGKTFHAWQSNVLSGRMGCKTPGCKANKKGKCKQVINLESQETLPSLAYLSRQMGVTQPTARKYLKEGIPFRDGSVWVYSD